ncbi:MAG: AMP-binding protein [Bacteroidota bacterium]
MTTPFNIVSHFLLQAEKHPDKIAVQYQDQSISYGQLKLEVIDTAAYFYHKGIRKGDRVLVFVPMSIDLYRNVLALFHLGATAVFLDEWVSRKRLDACCEVAQCKAFIGVFKVRLLSLFSSGLRKIPIKLGAKPKGKANSAFVPENTFPGDTALITFTTGSTGTPKAAKRTHGFLDEQFKALIDKIRPKAEDVDMTTLPIVLLINLGVGSTSIISTFRAARPEKTNFSEIARMIDRFQVSRIIASPYFVLELAKYAQQYKPGLHSLRQIFTGGAPVFQQEAAQILSGIPECKLEIVYGSTEAEPISSISGQELIAKGMHEKGLCVGIPYHGTQTRIISISDDPLACQSTEELDQITLENGRIGEIIVSGAHVLDAYFNNEQALKRNKIFIGNTCWHRTGDSGFLDARGELYLTGRCNTLLDYEGKIIAPFVYENKLRSIPEITMATVLEKAGKIVLCIELAPGLASGQRTKTEAKIRNLELIYHETRYLERIPRDPRHHSKIDYEKLKKQL